MSNQIKIDKEFCITDDSVNVYGYRLLTKGMYLDRFKKNPIGFLMHNRDAGVIVRWEDFRFEGDKIWAKPVINLAHAEGKKTVSDIENGFLNAASVGRIVVLEASDEDNLKLEGQTGATVTQWFPREVSLVDIPGNYEALAKLYDKDEQELNLNDLSTIFKNKQNHNIMSKLIFTAAVLTAMNLKAEDSQETLELAVKDLVDKAAKYETATQALVKANNELDALKKQDAQKEIEDLCAKGIAEKRLTVKLAEQLKVDYEGNPGGLKNLIANMPSQIIVTSEIGQDVIPDAYMGKNWDDLYATDELEGVRKNYPNLYEKLKAEKYPVSK